MLSAIHATQDILENFMMDVNSEITTLQALIDGISVLPDPESSIDALRASLARLRFTYVSTFDNYDDLSLRDRLVEIAPIAQGEEQL